MEPHAAISLPSVSNLVPSWDEDGGGSFEPAEAALVVEQAVHAEAAPRTARLLTPPEHFDAGEVAARPSTFAYDLLDDVGADEDGSSLPDYDLLRRRDIARELLRARLVSLAEQREHRSAYEIAFIMLIAAVSVLLAAPPLVQVLLAAHGTQA